VTLYLEDLSKAFDDRSSSLSGSFLAVDQVSLEIEDGKFFTLLGPSGCGKSTTLRMVAGLEIPDDGTIRIDDRILYSRPQRVNVPAQKRGLGMVFQSYAIWPHMTVRGNVQFALRGLHSRPRMKRSEIHERTEKALDLVGLGGLMDRRATKLSGGQQQRLALARAIAAEPPVMLLDEPLSNLDKSLRESIRLELKRMQRNLGITTLYVTHDQVEAMALSNTIAIMNHGKVEQIGRPRDVYNLPKTLFVADFIGAMNLITGVVASRKANSELVVDTALGPLVGHDVDPHPPGSPVSIAIRPENVVISQLNGHTASSTETNSLAAVLSRREFHGEFVELWFAVEGVEIRTRIQGQTNLQVGDIAHLGLPSASCAVLG